MRENIKELRKLGVKSNGNVNFFFRHLPPFYIILCDPADARGKNLMIMKAWSKFNIILKTCFWVFFGGGGGANLKKP